MTVIKITVIHSKGYNQITMGIETLRNIVIITTDIFAVYYISGLKIKKNTIPYLKRYNFN